LPFKASGEEKQKGPFGGGVRSPPIKVARAEKSVFRVKRAFPAAASTWGWKPREGKKFDSEETLRRTPWAQVGEFETSGSAFVNL
jgi:hypothetical protein